MLGLPNTIENLPDVTSITTDVECIEDIDAPT